MNYSIPSIAAILIGMSIVLYGLLSLVIDHMIDNRINRPLHWLRTIALGALIIVLALSVNHLI